MQFKKTTKNDHAKNQKAIGNPGRNIRNVYFTSILNGIFRDMSARQYFF